MMTYLCVFSMTVMLVSTLKKTNPIKMVVVTSTMASFVSLSIYMKQGEPWFSMLFLLLMLGGIMIMLSVMSSVEPNSQSKGFMSISPSIMILALMTVMSWPNKSSNSSILVKESFSSPFISAFLMLLILAYFTFFTLIISMESGSLRSL